MIQSLHLFQLAGAIFIFSIGIFVLKQNFKSEINVSFSVATITTSLWLFFYFLAYSTQEQNRAHLFFRIGYTFVIFMGVGVYHFVISYIRLQNEKKWAYLWYVVGGLLVISLWTTNLFISDKLYRYSWGLYPKSEIFQKVYLSLTVFIISRFQLILLKKYIQSKKLNDDVEKTRIKFVFWSILFLTLTSADFLPNYGFPIYPIGFIFAIAYSSTMSYAILRHQLLDIEVIIRRTAVFAGLFTFVYGVFTVVTVIGQEFFKNNLGWNQWLALVPTVFIITFALRPLENFLTNATERFLFQKKYDYRVLLKTFTNEVLTVLDIQQLPHQTVAGLIRILKLDSASILLHDKDLKLYKMVATIGVREKEIVFDEGGTFITYIKAANHPILKDKDADKMEGNSPLKDSFKKLNAQLCLPILLHEDLIGVLSLGAKKSGEDFTQEDVDILDTLARTEAIAISNARLFDELSKTQAEAAQREKMAVIGTLAAGINHEICNPLGIVRGQCEMFLLNYRDALYKNKTQEEVLKISAEVMNKVIKETDRATAITKKLSGFAKPSKKDEMVEVHVDKELDEVVSLIGHDLQLSNIEFKKDFPQSFPAILADHKQIQEILFNIIRNAAQAIDKKDGRIIVSGFSQNGSAIVRIADNGSGIPPDKIGQIFNPFYTTKAPGKGTGLGLFIVKQVVEKNKGTIAVESDAGIGTIFTLRFPVALPTMVEAA